MTNPETSVAVSAPGKVLFAGGFLVLDRVHSGLVFGLDARVHITVSEVHRSTSTTDTANHWVIVTSPQFQKAKWLYSWRGEHDGLPLTLHQLQETGYADSANPFVETTLRYAYNHLSQITKLSSSSQAVNVTILADEAYYSSTHATPETHQTANPTPSRKSFRNFHTTLAEVHKTGLGSSAALVTSLTAALLLHYLPQLSHPSNTTHFHRTIHNLAQAAHSAAQGKIGSGFDVAAAVYGTCLYKRFSPSILSPLAPAEITSSPDFGSLLHSIVQQQWDTEVKSNAVDIPKSMVLLMLDINHGTSTPSMVRKLLTWRSEKPEESALLWETLQQGTEDLCAELSRLCELDRRHSKSSLPTFATENLSTIIQTIRSLVREMSTKSHVPIEPPAITELLDYCTELPGVIGGVAPGAGGYDAVALLVKNDVEVLRDLQQRLAVWKSRDHGDGVVVGPVAVLKARQSFEGLKIEDFREYEGVLQGS